MRILFFADGRSIHTHRWVDAMAGSGFKVHLACWDGYTGGNESVTVHDLRALIGSTLTGTVPKVRALEWVWRARSVARRLAAEVDPGIVHGHFVRGYGHLARFSGVHPLVVTAWGSDIFGFSEQGAISRSLTRRTLRTADLVTCDSEDLRRGIVDLGTDPSRVEIVPFGVDTTMFTPTADPGPAERAIGIAPGVRLVVSPRGIAPTYCTTTLVRAFGQVAEQKDDLVLAVAGPISDTSYEQEVLDLSASLGIRDKVIFAGPQPHAMMPSLYARANVVVSVARTDSSPVSLLEAMATESVVVASDLPGVREWIRDAENGFLSAPDDVKGLAACLGSALSLDAGERSRWTAANRASVERRAEAGPACDLMVHWYETLVKRKLDDAETPGR